MTNQITTHMSHDHSEVEETMMERGVVTAALGNTWSHCVNTRLLLQFLPDGKRLVLNYSRIIYITVISMVYTVEPL